jgi:LPXTG-site transpeptidase (sortase) family protein
MTDRIFGRFWSRRDAGARDDESVGAPARRSTTRGRRVVLALLSVVGGAIFLFIGMHLYIQIAEWRDPSGRVYVNLDGERVYLVQPTAIVTPASSPPLAGGSAGTPIAAATERATSTSGAAPATAATATIEIPLPPLQLQIDRIGVDVPVVLATNENLPRQRLAGWFFKSAFPATAGNTVILGHLDGRAAIFGRLNELAPGDAVRVLTANRVHTYIVDSSATVDDNAVEMLAPTDSATLTLITCAGDWNADARSYDKRLVVRAHYAAVEPRQAP